MWGIRWGEGGRGDTPSLSFQILESPLEDLEFNFIWWIWKKKNLPGRKKILYSVLSVRELFLWPHLVVRAGRPVSSRPGSCRLWCGRHTRGCPARTWCSRALGPRTPAAIWRKPMMKSSRGKPPPRAWKRRERKRYYSFKGIRK